MHLSNPKGPTPKRELLLQNEAAFAQSFKNPSEAVRVELPMVSRHWPTASFPDHELRLPFFSKWRDFSFAESGSPPWEKESISSLIQTESDRIHSFCLQVVMVTPPWLSLGLAVMLCPLAPGSCFL